MTCASTEAIPRMAKIEIITNCVRRHVSEIKLKRTDTTLDLSQKGREAEEKRKGEEILGGESSICRECRGSVHEGKFCRTPLWCCCLLPLLGSCCWVSASGLSSTPIESVTTLAVVTLHSILLTRWPFSRLTNPPHTIPQPQPDISTTTNQLARLYPGPGMG